MTWPEVRPRDRLLRADPERGTTLVEVMVAMLLMTIFGAIFTGAMITLTRTTNKAQALTTSSTQTNQAYLTLDKTVRYARAITTPARGSGTGDWYVELRSTSSGVERCTQLRVDIVTQQLQRRTWATSSSTEPAFRQISSGIVNGTAATGTTQPFALETPGSTVPYQQLDIYLQATAGSAGDPATSTSSFSFTALNSTTSAVPAATCQQFGRP